jgi:hypothetical protein
MKEVQCEVGWIKIAQDTVQYPAFVATVMGIQIS